MFSSFLKCFVVRCFRLFAFFTFTISPGTRKGPSVPFHLHSRKTRTGFYRLYLAGTAVSLPSQLHSGPERALSHPFITTPENPNRVLSSVFSRNGCFSRVVRATAMGFIHLRIRIAVVLFLFLSQDKPGGTLTVPPIRMSFVWYRQPEFHPGCIFCFMDTPASLIGNRMFPFLLAIEICAWQKYTQVCLLSRSPWYSSIFTPERTTPGPLPRI